MDREKVIKEYEGYVNSYIFLTTSDNYEFEMHKAVLALLKEQEAEISKISNAYLDLVGKASKQPKIIRCKDCEYSYAEGFVNERLLCEKHPELGELTEDWFCADCWKA